MPLSDYMHSRKKDPQKEYEHKTVLIVGGRSQLGEALRRRYLAAGWNVVCTTQGKANHKLDDKEFHLVGGVNIGTAEAHQTNYWNDLFAKVQKEHGKIHTVVNCAGVAMKDKDTPNNMDNINWKPVNPMLEASVEMGINRFTHISTQAVKYIETHEPGSYAESKFKAEQDIQRKIQEGTKDTEVTIIRPDLIISGDNPGHFGSPSGMSELPFKITVGKDPRKAGQTTLQPVASYDVADAIVNISNWNLKTPTPIDACGPEVHTISSLLSLYKKMRGESFIAEIKLPTASLRPATEIYPVGAFEPDHLGLIEHHERNGVGPVCNKEFSSIVALSRPSDKENPLLPIEEVYAFHKRPNFGNHGILHYSGDLLWKVKTKDIRPLLEGAVEAATLARISFNANSPADEGINIGAAVLTMSGIYWASNHLRRGWQDSARNATKAPGNNPWNSVAASRILAQRVTQPNPPISKVAKAARILLKGLRKGR